ncbi:hypothetical protein CLV47_101306 [Antricoccus suffuscus]|uniref:Uncharacterized protein n=1 Tax=Antricoccus suffuscus TaxID=1629062 RepID=A0A2T1A6F8_9ACTN|nr:hypothetical protein [Antricoccus suffuscus]PRZ44181.1 hypothetical protein CLV47_101306 [Antricoccus suffuscus]
MPNPDPTDPRRTSTSWFLLARSLIGIFGLVVLPAILLYGYAISTAWFFGTEPSDATLRTAASALTWARVSASISLFVVVVLSGWLAARRVGALGAWVFCGLGIAVTAVVWHIDLPA